jgi:septum formation protein
VRLDRIVLASASPRRLELLRSLHLAVDVRPSEYAEPEDPNATPLELAIRHAREKVLDVRRNAGDGAVIVAADTVVDLDGIALGKPRSAGHATAILQSLSGREHLVHTAFSLTIPGQPEPTEESATTRVRFYHLTSDEIAEYVATGEPMDKAGAYGIQGGAASLVEAIDGDFYTVMGFPLARFVRTLRRLGFSLPSANSSTNS